MNWKKIPGELPTKNGLYLVVVGRAQIQIAQYNNARWQNLHNPNLVLPLNVTHWMDLPDLPQI